MSEEKQIEEMAVVLKFCKDTSIETCHTKKSCSHCIAEQIYNAGYRKQKKGKWEWFEEWNPSTPEHPRECDECGWQCSECKTALKDVIGGYWDDPEEIPNLNFCPECGARMEGA